MKHKPKCNQIRKSQFFGQPANMMLERGFEASAVKGLLTAVRRAILPVKTGIWWGILRWSFDQSLEEWE